MTAWYKIEIIHTYVLQADSESDAIVGHIKGESMVGEVKQNVEKLADVKVGDAIE
jgi:hypothetical protein